MKTDMITEPVNYMTVTVLCGAAGWRLFMSHYF